MDPAPTAPSSAAMSCSLPAACLAPRRTRWVDETPKTYEMPKAHKIPHHHHPNPDSPAATSDPIDIPDPNPVRKIATGSWMSPRNLVGFEHRISTESRIRHKLDNVTDYYSRGTRGWELAHDMQIERIKAEVGKILSGAWSDRSKWDIPKVVRKVPDFEAEQETGDWEDVERGEDWEENIDDWLRMRNWKEAMRKKPDFMGLYLKHVAATKKAKKEAAEKKRNAKM